METFWFCAIAAMIAVYAVLDGYDLGAGIAHLFVARSEDERRQVIQTIHPLWDGNEVWLVAAGTTLFFAFPKLYASSFAGFYLPLIIVLWLLVLRGIAIEFRDLIPSRAWRPFWDVVFGGSSALLAVFFGAALGNVVRGVPFDGQGSFFLPLWTDFRFTGAVGILDWYTASVGVAAFAAIWAHGALWVAYRTGGELELRARRMANRLWPFLGAVTLWITYLSFRVQPQLERSFRERPWGFVFPLIAILGFAAMRAWNSAPRSKWAFSGSCIYLLGMLMSAAFGVFPQVLPSLGATDRALTVYNAAAPAPGLAIGLYWFLPGIALAVAYSIGVHWKFSGKVRTGSAEH